MQHSSATAFYLEHNYIDAITYMGYSAAACRLAHAAAVASSSTTRRGGGNRSGNCSVAEKSFSAGNSYHSSRDSDSAMLADSNAQRQNNAGKKQVLDNSAKGMVAGKGEKSGNLGSPFMIAAVLLAGGAIGYSAFLHR